ncbi:hypothetical protein MASR1M45_01140 [Candidatus Kapaibacterium sp.]
MAFLDFVTLIKWKKFVKRINLPSYLYIIPIYISFLMMILYIYTNYYNLISFPVPEHIKSLNIITSSWYLPKIGISPFIIIFNTFYFIYKLLRKVFQKTKNISNQIDLNKYRIIVGTLWLFSLIPFIITIYGLLVTVNDVKVFRENIIIPKLQNNFDKIRIIQLSDLHFGDYMPQAKLNSVLEKIENTHPDLILITGDFVNFRYQEIDYGASFLKSLKAKYGVYACLGNHDHYMTDEDHTKLIKKIKATGVKLLINESSKIKIRNGELNLISVDNYGARQTFGDFDKAFNSIDSKSFNILMSHDPKTWEQFVVNKLPADLTLSGHTHAGQVGVDSESFGFSPAAIAYNQYKGLYRKGSQLLYVNRGLGVSGPPIRIGFNPEVTIIDIKSPEEIAKTK